MSAHQSASRSGVSSSAPLGQRIGHPSQLGLAIGTRVMSHQRREPIIGPQLPEMPSPIERMEPRVGDLRRVPNVMKDPGRDEQLAVRIPEQWSGHRGTVRHALYMRPPTRQLLTQPHRRLLTSPREEITHAATVSGRTRAPCDDE